MVPRPPARPARELAGYAVQLGLAGTVLVAPHADEALGLRAYGIAILLLPAVAGGICRVQVTPWQRCWLSLALSLHPLGAMYAVYRHVWWYDHLAHAASATLVAGVAYAVLVARDDRPRSSVVTHLAVFAVVVGAGVVWEVYELHVSYLVVYGPGDTVGDLLFDAVGWWLAVPAQERLAGRLPDGLRSRLAGDGR